MELDLIQNIIDYSPLLSLILEENYKKNKVLIECEVPEIGTKIENFSENNEKNIKKDYYDNYYRDTYFYPFFNMDKGNPSISNKYNITYSSNDSFNLYIFKKSNDEDIKIQINNKNIVQIIFNITYNKIELFIHLKNPPKVYSKQNNITSEKYFFYEKF